MYTTVPREVTVCPEMGAAVATTFIVTAIVTALVVFLITFLPTFFFCRHQNCNHTQDECTRPNTLPLETNDTTSNPSFHTPKGCNGEMNPGSAEHIQTQENIAYPLRVQIQEMCEEYYSIPQ